MNLHEREMRAFFHTYRRLPIEIERGDGVYLIARDGTRYLDMFAGLAVNALGYSHPRVLDAIRNQCEAYLHVSNVFLQEPQIRLAEMLLKITGYARVFFTNSGTEAVEGAMKIARRWGRTRNKSEILYFTNSYHGRSMGALSITGRLRYREGFEPFLQGCTSVTFNDPSELRSAVGNQTVAVIFEAIQGEGGIRPLSHDMAQTLAELQERYSFLLIADEIQCGMGRTGKFFGFEHLGLHPDLVLVAKALGGGLPLGAILGAQHLADVLEPGLHGSTFGGNPVASAAGCVVLEEITANGIMNHAAECGNLFIRKLRELRDIFPRHIRDVRGYGLMLGMELDRPCDPVVAIMRDVHRILVNCTDQTTIRFLPPLIIGEEEIRRTADALRTTLRDYISSP